MTHKARGVRLHKHLAARGIESRRTIEQWVKDGKIKIDGRIAQLGDKVSAHNRISINGRPLRAAPASRSARVLMYHKPEGEISARKDPRNRPSVHQRLPKIAGQRWVSVGRLDINTRGLLLFTNDGDLANRLMHPRFGLEREYLCRVYGKVDARALQTLRDGVIIDRETIRVREVRRHSRPDDSRNQWYSLTVAEGKYREVRRLWAAIGCQLSRLIRIRYGIIILPRDLRAGQWRELTAGEVMKLMRGGEAAGKLVGDAADKPAGKSAGKSFVKSSSKSTRKSSSDASLPRKSAGKSSGKFSSRASGKASSSRKLADESFGKSAGKSSRKSSSKASSSRKLADESFGKSAGKSSRKSSSKASSSRKSTGKVSRKKKSVGRNAGVAVGGNAKRSTRAGRKKARAVGRG